MELKLDTITRLSTIIAEQDSRIKELEKAGSNNVQCKVFLGDGETKADKEFNNWVATNPNIKIVDCVYKMSNHWNHSICIFYTEASEMDNPDCYWYCR